MLPGVIYTHIDTRGWYRVVVFHAHHKYVISVNGEWYDAWEALEDGTEVENNFSRRIAGLLNGLKRNADGEMVAI